MYKNKWVFLLLNIIFTILFFFIFSSDYNLLNYINSLFYLCFVYLLIVLFMYTAKGGFFDGVTFGFRRFNNVILKQNDHLEEWREKPLPSEKFNVPFYQTLKFQGLALFVLLLVLIILYYLL
ncbi:MAG: DUF3899 domain-containing protein [Bacillus sp. (in: Bacteria)]|nr:DUF3899 domain-containing protein [Bacillus sp. (in: firmicutes)]